MKPAHQGVAIAGLPGLQIGPKTAGLLPSLGWGAPATAPQPARAGNVKPESGTMDSWLLDRLFGRR